MLVYSISQDGKPVNDKMWRWSSWTLILNKLTSEDSGTYTCRATNSFGKDEININLHVTGMQVLMLSCLLSHHLIKITSTLLPVILYSAHIHHISCSIDIQKHVLSLLFPVLFLQIENLLNDQDESCSFLNPTRKLCI